jgi:hypothetical protein
MAGGPEHSPSGEYAPEGIDPSVVMDEVLAANPEDLIAILEGMSTEGLAKLSEKINEEDIIQEGLLLAGSEGIVEQLKQVLAGRAIESIKEMTTEDLVDRLSGDIDAFREAWPAIETKSNEDLNALLYALLERASGPDANPIGEQTREMQSFLSELLIQRGDGRELRRTLVDTEDPYLYSDLVFKRNNVDNSILAKALNKDWEREHEAGNKEAADRIHANIDMLLEVNKRKLYIEDDFAPNMVQVSLDKTPREGQLNLNREEINAEILTMSPLELQFLKDKLDAAAIIYFGTNDREGRGEHVAVMTATMDSQIEEEKLLRSGDIEALTDRFAQDPRAKEDYKDVIENLDPDDLMAIVRALDGKSILLEANIGETKRDSANWMREVAAKRGIKEAIVGHYCKLGNSIEEDPVMSAYLEEETPEYLESLKLQFEGDFDYILSSSRVPARANIDWLDNLIAEKSAEDSGE